MKKIENILDDKVGNSIDFTVSELPKSEELRNYESAINSLKEDNSLDIKNTILKYKISDIDKKINDFLKTNASITKNLETANNVIINNRTELENVSAELMELYTTVINRYNKVNNMVLNLKGSFVGKMTRNTDGAYNQTGDKADIYEQAVGDIFQSYDIDITREGNKLHVNKMEFIGSWAFKIFSKSPALVSLGAFFGAKIQDISIIDEHEETTSIYIGVGGKITCDVVTLVQYTSTYFRAKPGIYLMLD